MPAYWLKASKDFNKNYKDEWCLPPKGSEDYKLIQEEAEIYKKNYQNKTQKSKAVQKIQGLLREVQFFNLGLIYYLTE